MAETPKRPPRFNYRAAGIVIDRGRVLAHTDQHAATPHWALPGGHPELGESSVAALRREFAEELAIEITVGRLVWVTEVFADDEDGAFHEIGLYFEVLLPPESTLTAHSGHFKGAGYDSGHLDFAWLPLEGLHQTRLYPTFLRDGLLCMPSQITHLIHVDSGTGERA